MFVQRILGKSGKAIEVSLRLMNWLSNGGMERYGLTACRFLKYAFCNLSSSKFVSIVAEDVLLTSSSFRQHSAILIDAGIIRLLLFRDSLFSLEEFSLHLCYS